MTPDRNKPDEPELNDAAPARPARPLSPDLQAHIGVRLKAYYDSVLSEPIPSRFAELLVRLDGSDPHSGGGGGASGAETRKDPGSDLAAEDGDGSDVTT